MIIVPKKVVHGVTWLCAFSPKWNPYGPTIAGEHGILFRGRGLTVQEEDQDDHGKPMFRSGGPNKWQYLGQYKWTNVDGWNGAEWAGLEMKVCNCSSIVYPAFIVV